VTTDRARSAVSSRPGMPSYETLRKKERYLSLLFLVGLPYLQVKASDYWESIGGGVEAEGGDLFGDEEGGEGGGFNEVS